MSRVRICLWVTLLLTANVFAEGRGPHGPHYGGAVHDDRQTFWYLLDNRKDISRNVKELDDGVETLTESERPEVAARIQEHFDAIYKRLKEGRPIRQRDPLFAELFRHGDRIDVEIHKTPKGLHVKETSKDEYVVKLIKAHAQTISDFIEYGHDEARKNHPVPSRI